MGFPNWTSGASTWQLPRPSESVSIARRSPVLRRVAGKWPWGWHALGSPTSDIEVKQRPSDNKCGRSGHLAKQDLLEGGASTVMNLEAAIAALSCSIARAAIPVAARSAPSWSSRSLPRLRCSGQSGIQEQGETSHKPNLKQEPTRIPQGGTCPT